MQTDISPPPSPVREAPGNQSWKSNFLAIIEDARTPIAGGRSLLTGFELILTINGPKRPPTHLADWGMLTARNRGNGQSHRLKLVVSPAIQRPALQVRTNRCAYRCNRYRQTPHLGAFQRHSTTLEMERLSRVNLLSLIGYGDRI